tara:strand:+ start:29 stop:322 length:294 start_codon:yes stop_codon:yes gene_type:complete
MHKKNFTRKDISNKIYKHLGFSKNFSSSFVEKIFDKIISELENLNKVKISSFGTFEIINKKERIGRNPKTKVEAKIFARKIVKFKPSEQLKKQINEK